MPPFFAVPVLFLTFPVLVWLLDGAASEPASGLIGRFMHGFKPGFFFGFGYFAFGLWWIGNAFLVDAQGFLWALPIAVIAVPAVLALFWGVATGVAQWFWNGNVRRIFALAAALAVFEYLRGFVATGFPWNTLGSAAYPTPLFMQSASVLGIYAMTPFVVLMASFLGAIVPGTGEQRRSQKTLFKIIIVLLAVHTGFGLARMPVEPSSLVDDVTLRLVQPAIPQNEKFDLEKHPQHLRKYLDLSAGPGAGEKQGLSGTTHLIWSESVFPYLLTNRRDTLSAIAAMMPEGTSLITGAARAEIASAGGDRDFVFNSVYVINHEGLIVSAADKTHLVPFGEYLPFQSVLESLGLRKLTKFEGSFEPGASRKLLSTGVGPSFLPLICYEIIFSGALWQGEERPGYMVNLTNDAWFGLTPGPYQHSHQSIIRAVEEGLPLVRVANTGISGVYDAYGRTIASLGLGEEGVLDSGLPKALERTIYSRFGNWIFWGMVGLFFLISVAPMRKSAA